MIYKQIRNLLAIVFSLAITDTFLSLSPAQALAVGDHLDVTFHNNGKVASHLTGDEYAYDVAIQADGKIVIVGKMGTWFALVRYNTNGTLDTTFSGDGFVTVAAIGIATAVAIQPDGKIVVAGPSESGNFVIARFNADGSFDSTFNSLGVAFVSFPSHSSAEASAIAIQPDGSIVVVGWAVQESSAFNNWAIARFLPNGALILAFSGDGREIVDFEAQSFFEQAQAVTVLSGGKILIGGTAGHNAFQDFALARLNSNGTLDSTFDGDGKILTGFASSLQDMKIQPDGKIVAAGVAAGSDDRDFAVARFNADGSFDNSFDSDGRVQTDSGADELAFELAIQSDGKIVAAGVIQDNPAPIRADFVLVRYLPNGSLDASFGQSGKIFTDMFNNSDDHAYAVALQSDGKIVVAGTTRNFDSTNNFGVARYLPNFPVSGSSKSFDFDGDGKTDLSIFRPSNGQWWINRSSNGSTFAATFGINSDRITPADFTGDGKTDIAFWRPSNGNWFVLRSEDSSFYSFPFGTTGDVPVPADYDADGKADAAVFRPSTNTWYIMKSGGGTDILTFGGAGDKAVPADYDGDSKADLAIFRPTGANGAEWWIRRSSNGSVFALTFGTSTDKAVQGDYTGDGKADVAFWRPSNGNWFVLRSENFSFYSFPFGANGDTPVAGDYDGDGKIDAAVFRPSNSTWYVNKSTGGNLIQAFGAAGDIPTPNAFVP